MDVTDALLELSKNSQIHGQRMYVSGLRHAIDLIGIDAEKGLAMVKERLEQENAELEEMEAEACND